MDIRPGFRDPSNLCTRGSAGLRRQRKRGTYRDKKKDDPIRTEGSHRSMPKILVPLYTTKLHPAEVVNSVLSY